MSYDNLCKYLAEQYPEAFASWVLGKTVTSPVEVLKTELSLEPIRADSVTFLRTATEILHLEFQVRVDSGRPISLRMLNYWLRLYWQYQIPIKQVLIWLKPTNHPTVFETQFESDTTQHRYNVIRLWEQPPGPLLTNPALLPLAVLCETQQPRDLLTQVAAELAKIEATQQRQEMTACTEIIAGLRFDRELLASIFREDVMRESVVYQDILQRGVEQGLAQGQKREARAMILRPLTRRFGPLSAELQAEIESLTVPQLEDLNEISYEFRELADLETWLASHRSNS